MVAVHFLLNYSKKEGTGKFIYTPLNMQKGTNKFIYTPSILDNEQLLSNMINHKATQVSTKIFYPAIVD